MPIYARRRLQSMLQDLAPLLSPPKISGLLSGLESKSTKDALATEMELGLLWGIQKVADIEIEPAMNGSTNRPDAFSNSLFEIKPAFIEITALSDDTFSGKKDMAHAANIICQFSDQVRPRASRNLYFEFSEASYFEHGRFHRNRQITSKFTLTPELESTLRDWLAAPDWPNREAVQLTNSEINVMVRWREYVHPRGKTFRKMPPIAYDVEDNILFKALNRKRRQVSGAPTSTLKCIFLGDVGCNMLRNLKSYSLHEVNGDQVIRHFLSKSSIDVVVIFSPQLGNWRVSLYTRSDTPAESECKLIQALADILPKPRLDGYQARSWHEQGEFRAQSRGIYEGTSMSIGKHSTSIRISSRLVLELLSGRITQQQFQHFAFNTELNEFDTQFRLGRTLQAARLEKGGIDQDDDYLIFDLEDDYGAQRLTRPKQ